MNVFKIAWRSLQHRGLGSLLTIISMGLGVMMVVSVLSIHGLVSKSFKTNSSFGFNVLVGARGGGMQLTLNSVYYLSNPVENIPYEYYLAFCDQETRQTEMRHSFAFQTMEMEAEVLSVLGQLGTPAGPTGLTSQLTHQVHGAFSLDEMEVEKRGIFHKYTDTAIPLCLGDFWEAGDELHFRCVATKPDFFQDLVLDIDTEEKFQFSDGRCFEKFSDENGYFECVVGAVVAKRGGLKVGDTIKATHGDPNSPMAHVHEQLFTVVGVVAPTGTPNDRVVFLNMEGFFLMEDHAKPVYEEGVLSTRNDEEDEPTEESSAESLDPLEQALAEEAEAEAKMEADSGSESQDGAESGDESNGEPGEESNGESEEEIEEGEKPFDPSMFRIPLPIEQREVTSMLIRTSKNDQFNVLGTFLPPLINEGDLETTLGWSAYRPVKSQKAAQSVNPIDEVTKLFSYFVDPVRWILLALTVMICIVSAISILVGIYNSMAQRQKEIAIMRALGANRLQVMLIMMLEALLLACLGGLLGWIAGHSLNVALSPFVEARTGVGISFLELAPGIPLGGYFSIFGGNVLPDSLAAIQVSPELLLIPGLILLAVIVGTYPAISAYRTDVSSSL